MGDVLRHLSWEEGRSQHKPAPRPESFVSFSDVVEDKHGRA